jgi:hypothetical protein
MSTITQLADPFIDAFSALSVNGPPPDELFVFVAQHSIHQQPASPVNNKIQSAPTVSNILNLEQNTESAYSLELLLDTASIRRIVQGRRKFVNDIRRMLDSIPHLAEINVKVTTKTIPQMATKRNMVTDLFWTTVNASLFCNRDSLIKYTAEMDGASHAATTGEEVRVLLEDLMFMVV